MGLWEDIKDAAQDFVSDPVNAIDPFGARALITGEGGFTGATMGLLSGQGATDDAIAAQERAARDANATQLYMYDQTRQDFAPWREAGVRALGGMEDADYMRDFTMSDFTQDPGYQFRMQEGMKAIERSAAAGGGLNSGRTMKALTQYGQNLAAQEYQNAYDRFNADRDRRFNRLGALAGVGQTAQTQVGQAGQNYANNVSANQIGLGNANAAAHIAGANRQSQLMGTGISAAALAFSDERLKTNIQPIAKEDIEELRRVLKPYAYNYIDDVFGEGDWVGVMAQDLEKSKLGRTAIIEDEDGHKMIDMRKVGSLFLAAIAEG